MPNASQIRDNRNWDKWNKAGAVVSYANGLPIHSLVYRNIFTNNVDAVATKPKWMNRRRFENIVLQCRLGNGYKVADDMLAVLAANPRHRHCFLVPN